jgi:microcystin-dependent protein
MDTYLGDIFLFAFQFAPVGWMSCEGQILNISQNPKSKIEKRNIMNVEVFIGTILLFPYSFIPTGSVPCDGRLLQIVSNQALFALIGNLYGGDGRTNFAVPNLNGAETLPQMRYYIALTGIFPQRP